MGHLALGFIGIVLFIGLYYVDFSEWFFLSLVHEGDLVFLASPFDLISCLVQALVVQTPGNFLRSWLLLGFVIVIIEH